VHAQHEGEEQRHHHHPLTNQSMHTQTAAFVLVFNLDNLFIFETLKHSQKFPSVYVECTFISMNILNSFPKEGSSYTYNFLGVGSQITKLIKSTNAYYIVGGNFGLECTALGWSITQNERLRTPVQTSAFWECPRRSNPDLCILWMSLSLGFTILKHEVSGYYKPKHTHRSRSIGKAREGSYAHSLRLERILHLQYTRRSNFSLVWRNRFRSLPLF
jgi:hypothetical protein